YAAGSKVRLIVLAGHRNMEGERAFVQDLAKLPGGAALLQPDLRTAGRYSQGGGYSVSDGWEPMGPWGEYETFGPELSFAATMRRGGAENIAIAKFTHSGSQIIDWTPEGSEAKGRNLYPSFLEFVRQSVQDLRDRGHEVELSGICYHVGENDMSWGPFRQGAPERVLSLVQALRKDLQQPQLRWYISQQLPSDHESVRSVDVMSRMSEVLAGESGVVLLQALDLPPQREQLVLDAAGVVRLGELLASSVLSDLRVGRQR
ncbi:MAG: sialate O-acetylesterase, partial [Planctomycetaceae bacterium]